MPDHKRRAHVIADRDSRLLKSAKIIKLIGEQRFGAADNLLEVGCGSGVISSALAVAGQGQLDVCAVDVADNRIEKDGYDFQQIDGTTLPYPDKSFDLVVTNHVIEHVGDRTAQLHHLQEITRVLKPDGLIYLAVPNRWRVFEPHYRLPLLSWLPQWSSDAYVRLSRRGTHYDCRPLGPRDAIALFREANMQIQDATLDALRATLSIEHHSQPLARLINKLLPNWMLSISMPIIPTFVFLLRPRQP